MSLCAECDRCFHLSVSARPHVRVPLQESEEQMAVTVQDGTARLKTPLLVLAIDAEGAKAVLELKTARADSAQLATCRFCKLELTAEQAASSEVPSLASHPPSLARSLAPSLSPSLPPSLSLSVRASVHLSASLCVSQMHSRGAGSGAWEGVLRVALPRESNRVLQEDPPLWPPVR